MSKNLEVDHIKPFAVIFFENNIRTFKQAMLCKELWDNSNARVVCKSCHLKTDTFGIGTKNILKEMRKL